MAEQLIYKSYEANDYHTETVTIRKIDKNACLYSNYSSHKARGQSKSDEKIFAFPCTGLTPADLMKDLAKAGKPDIKL